MPDNPEEQRYRYQGQMGMSLAQWLERLERRMNQFEQEERDRTEGINDALTGLKIEIATMKTATEASTSESKRNTQQNRWIIGLAVAILLGLLPVFVRVINDAFH